MIKNYEFKDQKNAAQVRGGDIMSEDGKFLLRWSMNKIDIYAISTSPDSVELLLYVSITNLSNLNMVYNIKMYSNIVYFKNDTQLIAFNIYDSSVTKINLDYVDYFSDYFVYKGILCFLTETETRTKKNILIINIDETQYEINLPEIDFNGLENVHFKHGILYVCGCEKIYIIDIEANNFAIINNIHEYELMFPTPYGFIYTTLKNIVLPSGKEIGIKDFCIPDNRLQSYLKDIRGPRKWITENMDTNHNENILICVVRPRSFEFEDLDNIAVLIDLETETVIECINFNPKCCVAYHDVGFLYPDFLEPMKPIILEFPEI
jgi:hypothetical protein